ncbi:MAG: hypothetical protein HYR55_13935 [Acidobacteria bacterium]|nr:hypothetical protein [Acidobacteriota bacterium]MBI3658477.1 hypothetical protein [Acidobacteriota bacterium]
MEKYLEGGDLTEPLLGFKNLAAALLFLCQIVPDYDRLLPMRKIGFPVYSIVYGFIVTFLFASSALGSWTRTGDMDTERAGINWGALLPDGRVFFAFLQHGGLYNPTTMTWSTTSSTPSPVGGPAVLLQNGTVLVTGGQLTPIYSPLTDSWTPKGVFDRGDHTATLLQDGRVLVTGGRIATQVVSSTRLFDLTTNAWTDGPDMNSPRALHTATLLLDGTVLVTGGYTNSAEIFDPVTNTWTNTENRLAARFSHTATLLTDGRVLAVGGSGDRSCEVYDSQTSAWVSAADTSMSRENHFATLLPDGRVLVGGGGTASAPFASSEIFNPSTGAGFWQSAGDMNVARAYSLAVLLNNGTVLAAGGTAGEDCNPLTCWVLYTRTAEIFTP